jgi:3',5'-cyclic AMP phosphodiesterase CpdA
MTSPVSIRQFIAALSARLLIFALAAGVWCASAFADLNFVQLTDPHIFDGKGDIKGNKEALKWSVDEINRGQEEGKDYQFVVMTGDLGLEGLADYLNPEKQHSDIVSAAHELAGYLKTSKVGKWLFVPGNNDLVEENPGTIDIYREFVQALKSELPDIQDLSMGDFELPDGKGTYRFIGFDNASFKANDSSINAECFESTRLRELQRVADRVQDAPGFVYLFYHVPGIDDPYYASLSPDNSKLKDRAKSRRQFGKDFPLSAWTVTPAVRDRWDAVVKQEKVKGLFAGHFHSADSKDYEDANRMNSASYIERGKLYICPPLASKKQEDKNPQARGLSLVRLQPDGSVARKIV